MINLVSNKTGTVHAFAGHNRSHTLCGRLIDLGDPIKQWRIGAETADGADVSCRKCQGLALDQEHVDHISERPA